MSTIFAEAILAQVFRQKKDGEVYGGPAYYISQGIKNKRFAKILSIVFAIFLILALGFAGNMVQSNSIALSMQEGFGINPAYTGIALAVLVSMIVMGGVQRISKIAEMIVPVMAAVFILSGLVILFMFRQNIIPVFKLIFQSAFSTSAVFGGAVGISVQHAIKMGLARGLFANEAGIGSTPHANAIADVDHASKQGYISMITVIIDTFIVCTVSALIILVTGANEIGSAHFAGVLQNGFDIALGGSGSVFYAISVFFFGFTTILGWYYYGESNVMYLFGEDAINYYKIFAIIAIVGGTIVSVGAIYNVSDLLNGLMVIPNILGILILSTVVKKNKNEINKLK